MKEIEELIDKKLKEFENKFTFFNGEGEKIILFGAEPIIKFLSTALPEASNKGIADCVEICDNSINKEQNKLNEEPKKVEAYKDIKQQLIKRSEWWKQ